MFERILIPTDDSPGSDAAIEHALDLAERYEATVHTISVVEAGHTPVDLDTDEREQLRASRRALALNAINAVVERAETRGIEVSQDVRQGVPYRTILEYGREHEIDLIVMGTRGLTDAERARLGSTTERVITLGDIPVLSVRLAEGGHSDSSYDDIVIPTDGSDVAERAAEYGLELAAQYGANVHVVYVVDAATYGYKDAPRSIIGLLKEGGQQATEAIADTAQERDVSVRTSVLRGVPEEEILAYGDRVEADLIAIGTRGRAAGSDRIIGSTTARILRRAEVPVLTVS